jgi:hypothetical protein
MVMRYVIPAIGYTPRPKATLMTTLDMLPEEVISQRVQGRDQIVPRWMQGVTFQSVGNEPLRRIAASLCEPSELKEAREPGMIYSFDPFVVYDAQQASLICSDLNRVEQDMEQRYPSMVSAQIANELMAGGVRVQAGEDNHSLSSAAALVAGGPYRPNDALALLEQAAADFLHGGQGVIHITPRGFSYLNFFDQAEMIDMRWNTSQGHLIVADAGYEGTEPEANFTGPDAPNIDADEWWYISGSVFYTLTEFVPIGAPDERIDYELNKLTSIEEATALVIFDPGTVVAVPVCYEPFCGELAGS